MSYQFKSSQEIRKKRNREQAEQIEKTQQDGRFKPKILNQLNVNELNSSNKQHTLADRILK